MATRTETGDLESELAALLEIERFEPPEDFREKALWSDPAVYEEAAADPEGLVASPGDRARRLVRGAATVAR